MATYQITFSDTRFDDMPAADRIPALQILIDEGVLGLDSDPRVKVRALRQIDEDVVLGAEIAADASSLMRAEMCSA